MLRIRILSSVQILSLVAALHVSVACKKDESKLPEKLAVYQLLCPSGIDACYNDCGTSSGVSSGGAAGEELRAFNACAAQCDVVCDTRFLFVAE